MSPAAPFEILLSPDLWETAPEPRQREWRALIRELEHERDGLLEGTERLEITLTEQGVVITGTRPKREPITCSVSRQALTPHVTEYADIIRKLAQTDDGMSSSRFEALDMAKKAAHDAGARTLMAACASLGFTHTIARRLFSLIFALRVDTTELASVLAHRPIR